MSETSLFITGRRPTAVDIDFVQALTESCDTWFYQVGIKTGAEPIIDWALKLGFGVKCGIPLRGEVEGRIPNDQYMRSRTSESCSMATSRIFPSGRVIPK